MSLGYQLTFGSPKTLYLVVNGDSVAAELTAPSASAWMQRGLRVPLVAGTNEIAVHGFWNWVSLDFFAVEGVQASGVGAEAPGDMGTWLGPNRPNPFHEAAAISYTLPAAEHVRLEVFDLTGRRVATLVDGPMAAGTHTVDVEAGTLPGSVYLYRLRAGSAVQTRRIVVVR